MSIRWKPAKKRNPMNNETGWYAQIADRHCVDFERLADEIEKETALTASDALSMLRTMQHLVIKHLQDNCTVKFDQLGTFAPAIKSASASEAKEVTADLIKGARVSFIAGSALRKAMQRYNLTFEKYVQPVSGSEDETA